MSPSVKLLAMNVRTEVVPWVSDFFLSHRQQCVRHHNSMSDWSYITCGVPQGTKIDPNVFLAMINGMATGGPASWKYVDDSTIGENH